jgi:hypothetical protein
MFPCLFVELRDCASHMFTKCVFKGTVLCALERVEWTKRNVFPEMSSDQPSESKLVRAREMKINLIVKNKARRSEFGPRKLQGACISLSSDCTAVGTVCLQCRGGVEQLELKVLSSVRSGSHAGDYFPLLWQPPVSIHVESSQTNLMYSIYSNERSTFLFESKPPWGVNSFGKWDYGRSRGQVVVKAILMVG